MALPTFLLEDYFQKWEFTAKYLLCSSDAESWPMQDILALADAEAKELWQTLRLGYAEIFGLPLLRAEIAKLYGKMTSENILCFAGAEDGILCAALALLGAEDHAVVVSPCYQSLYELPKSTGADISTVELREDENWQLDLNRVKAALRANTKMIWVNFPHNPTGARLTKTQIDELVDIAREREIILFSDEVYRLLDADNTGAEPALADMYENALSLGVMSKSYGAPGLRIGWIASQNIELLDKMARIKHYTTICNSGPSEVLALIMLRAGDKIIARNNEIVRTNLAELDQFFSDYKDLFSWVRPAGGCIGFPRYLGSEKIDDFCRRLVEEKGVLLLPGSAYGIRTNNFRIGFGRKNFSEALAQAKLFIDQT